ncbi:hypothetical protein ABZ883_12370 [Streptomyces sp. NPDC046977]|uniref:hypothetical protein n=1 Tax=Streptomyces sp. NPDC046977 TaxID=3154703 RepID=UPI0033E4473B
MSRDNDLTARSAEPGFWPLYLFDSQATEAYAEAREDEEPEEDEILRAEFPLDRGLGLRLEFEPGIEYVDLAVLAPDSAEARTVGWDDTAHFHPHVMPWSELDLLCRAVALRDPASRYPGPMLALLLRFAFLSGGEDLDTITPLVDAAFSAAQPAEDSDAASRAGVREETRDWFDLRDLRGTRIEWADGPDGCRTVTQHDRDGAMLYSLREPASDEFPFAAWSGLLARATELLDAVRTDPAVRTPAVLDALGRCTGPEGHRHVGALATALSRAGFGHPVLLRALAEPVAVAEAAWAVETLAGTERGTVVAAWCGTSPLAGSRSWRLSLILPAAGRPVRFAQAIAGELSAELHTSGLGWAEVTGSTSVQGADGGHVRHSDQLDLLIRDDLPRGVRVIARLLRGHQAAETAELTHMDAPYERIPLLDPST